MPQQQFDNRALTRKLRELALTVHDTRMNDEGEVEYTTKGEALAEEVFKSALGHWEEIEEKGDVPGQVTTKKVWRKPEAWAKQFIWDRLEGKSPTALPDDKGGLSVGDKVSELAKARINQMTEEQTDGDSEHEAAPDTDG
jgi:hypothetical protein